LILSLRGSLRLSSIFDEDCFIPPLGVSHSFPNPRHASDEGLLAYGGDLSPNRLLNAYRRGIFPWFSPNDPILWWSPNPRMVLYPDRFKLSKSLSRTIRNKDLSVLFDDDFALIITQCGGVPRRGQNGTWLTSSMQEAYIQLHEMGFAHSVAVYEGGELAGGLYGIALGRAFFGESMFSLRKDGSKIAFKALSDVLGMRGYDFIDCQVSNPHLVSLGAIEIERDRFLDELKISLTKPTDLGLWENFRWEH